MTFCFKATTLCLRSVFRSLFLKETHLDNRVASGLLEPNPVPNNMLAQNQSVAQLQHRIAEYKVLAGPVRRASDSVPPSMDSDPELSPLY